MTPKKLDRLKLAALTKALVEGDAGCGARNLTSRLGLAWVGSVPPRGSGWIISEPKSISRFDIAKSDPPATARDGTDPVQMYSMCGQSH